MWYHGLTDICTQFISQFSVFAFVAERFNVHMSVMCGTVGTAGVGWNAGECCLFPNSTAIPVDDVAYTRTAVNTIQSLVNVLPTHIFAMGHSNGAFMSEALACNASDIFRAVVSNAGGTILSPGDQAGLDLCTRNYQNNATSVLLIHGTGDTAVPYNGSSSSHLPSVMTDLSAWVKRNECKDGPVTTFKQGPFHNLVFSNCRQSQQRVELMTVDGGIHMWYLATELQSSHYALQFFDRVAPRPLHNEKMTTTMNSIESR